MSTNLTYANLLNFANVDHETFDFLICKGESGVPRLFISCSVLIQELNFVLVYILARYYTYQGEFFASEVAHFLTHCKKCAWW